jgi:hypothetical protein
VAAASGVQTGGIKVRICPLNKGRPETCENSSASESLWIYGIDFDPSSSTQRGLLGSRNSFGAKERSDFDFVGLVVALPAATSALSPILLSWMSGSQLSGHPRGRFEKHFCQDKFDNDAFGKPELLLVSNSMELLSPWELLLLSPGAESTFSTLGLNAMSAALLSWITSRFSFPDVFWTLLSSITGSTGAIVFAAGCALRREDAEGVDLDKSSSTTNTR